MENKNITIEELNEIFNKEKRKVRNNVLLFSILLLTDILILLYFFYIKEDMTISALIFSFSLPGFLILGIILFGNYTDLEIGCENYLKNELKKYNLKYYPDKDISLYIESKVKDYLFTEDDKYFFVEESNNLIVGEYFKYGYTLLAHEYTVEDSEGNKRTEYDYKDAVILIGELDKRFNGFYVLSAYFDIYGLERIKLDLPEFEKLFDLYGTDQIEGRYIFDFTFMESLIEVFLMKKFEVIVFSKGKFYILFNTDDLYFQKNFTTFRIFFSLIDIESCVKDFINTVLSYESIYKKLIKNEIALKLKNKSLNILQKSVSF